MEFKYTISIRSKVDQIKTNKNNLLKKIINCKSIYNCIVKNKIEELNSLTLTFISNDVETKLFKIIIIFTEKEKLKLIFNYLLDFNKNKINSKFPFICIDNIYEFVNELEDKLFNLIYKQKSARS